MTKGRATQRGIIIFCFLLCLSSANAWAQVKFNHEAPLELITAHSSKTIKLSSYRGKVLVIDFWASWCGPCLKSMPYWNRLRNQFADRGFEVIAVNLDNSKKQALAYLEKKPVDYLVVRDATGVFFNPDYLLGLPISYLIDAHGTVVLKHAGFKAGDEAYFEAVIERLIEIKEFENSFSEK